MSYQLVYCAVRESQRRAVHAVRVHGDILEPAEIEEIADRIRDRLASRGEVTAEVVVLQGSHQHTLRFFGHPHAVTLVRAAMFNAAVSWSPLDLD
jgi:translation initiation factor 1 (eIF-1/SUI1)